ncbi:hypothetical protein F4X86_03995 [Candidatus Saccharibacteria bacterium]|nr:hypothetical protein [Candidatus Saccharibacteria bacterium]
MRFILRTHLEENDPDTLRRWHRNGELETMLDVQANAAVDVLKWQLGDDPYAHPDPAKRMIAWEYAKAQLLEYPQSLHLQVEGNPPKPFQSTPVSVKVKLSHYPEFRDHVGEITERKLMIGQRWPSLLGFWQLERPRDV